MNFEICKGCCGIADAGLLISAGAIDRFTKEPSCVHMPTLGGFIQLHVPSLALPRPRQGRTSWLSAYDEVLNGRSCRISSSYARPWWNLAWPTW